MKRLAIIIAAAVILSTGLLLVAPQFIPADAARTRIAEQIEQWIGRPVSFVGEPIITFFPRPSVRLQDVVITDGEGSEAVFISVDELVGTFRLLPMLIGRVEANSFELIRPTIALRVDEEGRTNWSFGGTLGDRVADAQLTRADGETETETVEVALGRFQIVDGTITYDEPGAEIAMVSEVTLDFRWPSTAAQATATGSLIWEGERVDLSATLIDPLELIAGRPSLGEFVVTGDPIRMTFDGSVGRNGLDFTFDGETTAAMGSLRHVIDWAGASIGRGETLADAAIAGHVEWEWPILSFSDAEMSLDGNNAIGAFTVDFSGDRVEIIGTLALTQLDLTPYADAFLSDLPDDQTWEDVPINLPLFDYVDADIRISADRLNIGATHLEGLAASAISDQGDISLQIAEGSFYGGRFRASLTAHYEAPLFQTEIQMQLTDVEVAAALADIVGTVPIGGRLTGNMSLTTEGTDWGQLVEQMMGQFSASVSSGTIYGADLSPAIEAPEPAVDTVVIGSGETRFDAIEALFSVHDGQIFADSIDVAGLGYSIAFAGHGSLLAPTIGGSGDLLIGAGEDIHIVPFVVTGTWLEPHFDDGSAPADRAEGASL